MYQVFTVSFSASNAIFALIFSQSRLTYKTQRENTIIVTNGMLNCAYRIA